MTPKRNLLHCLLVSLLLFVAACGSSNSGTPASTAVVPTSSTIARTGEPVTDFLAKAKELNAVDTSFLSVDKTGTYGIQVTDRFVLFRFTVDGWYDMTTETSFVVSADGHQMLEDVVIEKAFSVTTRDYTGDRENDFLIGFGSGFKEYGAIFSARGGAWGARDFCLIYPSKDRPGKTRTAVIEDLAYDETFVQGQDYSADGNSVLSYWRWDKKNDCFMDTANR